MSLLQFWVEVLHVREIAQQRGELVIAVGRENGGTMMLIAVIRGGKHERNIVHNDIPSDLCCSAMRVRISAKTTRWDFDGLLGAMTRD